MRAGGFCGRPGGRKTRTSAPNPKFAHIVRQMRSRTSGSKGALELWSCQWSWIPRLVSECAASAAELRNRTTGGRFHDRVMAFRRVWLILHRRKGGESSPQAIRSPLHAFGVLPPPLWGRAGEGGRACGDVDASISPPPPPTPPHKGEGSAPSSRQQRRHRHAPPTPPSQRRALRGLTSPWSTVENPLFPHDSGNAFQRLRGLC